MDRLIRLTAKIERPSLVFAQSGNRQAGLLARILLFLVLFSLFVFFTLIFFDPHNDPAKAQYEILIGGLVIFFVFAYILNYKGYYFRSACLLVFAAFVVPWVSLAFDPSILRGDIVPLVYVTFSVLLSSIFLPPLATFVVAALQFIGVVLAFRFSMYDSSLNWFSFLTYFSLTSFFSILANRIIQRDMKHIADQNQQLAVNESLLREQSIHDYLTNLYNRRFLEEFLLREIQRSLRKQTCVGIILLDVDHFKKINDTHGHPVGDVVLKELAKFISEQVRQSDIACRYGGDEFVLVLPDASREITAERAEKLRLGVGRLRLPVSVSLSLGVAVFPENGADIHALLRFADEALFNAKHHGGDCVM